MTRHPVTRYSNRKDLILKIRDNFEDELFSKLSDSLPERLENIIKNKRLNLNFLGGTNNLDKQEGKISSLLFLHKQMSEVIENADRRANKAAESLRRAEDRLGGYLQGTLTLPTGVTFQDLRDEVARCTAVLEGAQQTLQALASQNTIPSPQSSFSSISCKSQSINGPCSTGRHTDRNKGIQKTFKRKLVNRDNCCIATGETEGSVAAHIIPLDKSELIARDLLYSPRNGVLLHETLEDDYDRHKWIFDYDGNVTVLYSKWIHKNTIRHVNISKDPETGPSKELIEMHNQMALEQKQHYCPYCWKYVGAVNIENHTAGSCEAIDEIGDENGDI